MLLEVEPEEEVLLLVFDELELRLLLPGPKLKRLLPKEVEVLLELEEVTVRVTIKSPSLSPETISVTVSLDKPVVMFFLTGAVVDTTPLLSLRLIFLVVAVLSNSNTST